MLVHILSPIRTYLLDFTAHVSKERLSYVSLKVDADTGYKEICSIRGTSRLLNIKWHLGLLRYHGTACKTL